MKRKAKQKKGATTSVKISDKRFSDVHLDGAVELPQALLPTETANLAPVSVDSPHAFSFSYVEKTSPKSFSVELPQMYGGNLQARSSQELCSFTQLDDQSSESRDHEEVTNVASNSDHDFLLDDEVSPEHAVHRSFVTSVPLSPAEQKHFTEKSDTGLLHNPRRINKRELKALLKQTKRNRSILDDTSIAAIDDLASRLQSSCLLGSSPTFSNPISVAPPPYFFASPTRKGFGGKKGGRAGARRGKSSGRTSFGSQANTPPVLPASWTPLMLPYNRSPGSDVSMKPIFSPWLNELSESRVQRFTSGMRNLLSKFLSETNVTSNRSHEFDKFSNTSHTSHPASCLLTETPKAESKDVIAHTEEEQVISSATCPGLITKFDNVDSGIASSGQVDLSELTKHASKVSEPNRSCRGRYRRRRPYKSRGSFTRNSECVISQFSSQVITGNPTVCVASDTPIDIVGSPSAIIPRSMKPSKSRVSRELRGLVTWDAVIAQQKRQEAQDPENECVSIEAKQLRRSDPTVAIAEGMLAQAALDISDTLVTRTRRLRHSSGVTLVQAPQSTCDSETASVTTVTASESTEVLFRLRHSEQTSTARSAVSTASSSVASDMPTTHQLPTDTAVDGKPAKCSRRIRTGIESQIGLHHCKPHLSLSQSPGRQPSGSPNEATSHYLPKYSPISVDPELESQFSLDDVQQISHEKPVSPQNLESVRRNGKCFRRRLYSETQTCLSLSIVSDPSVSASATESGKVAAFSSPTSGFFEKRRRSRQHISNSLCGREVQVGSTSSELPPAQLEASRVLYTPVDSLTAESNSIRRSATSRNSVLPPRKRYKAGAESHNTPATELNLSSQHEDEAHRNSLTSSAATVVMNCPTPFLVTEPRLALTNTDNRAIVPSDNTIQKRTRGRPARRGLIPSQPPPAVPALESPPDIHNQRIPMDRPKREAAVIGFASLVSANLNNNTQVPGSLILVDSPDTRNGGVEVTNSSASACEFVTMPVISSPLPRGRGRPPKVKMFAPVSDISPSSAVTDSQPGPTQPTRRQLRPSSPCEVGIPPPNTSSVDDSTQNQPPSVASSTPEAQGAPTNVPSEPPSISRGIRRVGRPRLHHFEEQKEDSAKEPIEQPFLNASINTASAFRLLPKHNSLFKGHLLTDSIPPGVESKFQRNGPLCDVFARLLNEPDPNDPTSRLVSPILYLPLPERYPEFYRFILSAYSGTLIRTRFIDTFFKRVFSYEPSQAIVNDPIFSVEFPSLCLASIANWFTLQSDSGKLKDQLCQDLKLTESEMALISLNPSDAENSMPLLDAAVENVLSVWESFAGRRSWLGRRISNIRSFYFTLRNECVRSVAGEYEQIIPPLKATAVLNMPASRSSSGGGKKKADRRALERGAEVIRCLCGFRVEGGHVMVQCDRCASWQHLPCLWWALSQAIKQTAHDTETSQLCEAALFAAQLAGSGCPTDFFDSVKSKAPEHEELPYFCPICLNLTNLTLDYPRSLPAAMAVNDINAVFDLQETADQGEREFWSLASVNNRHQIRTDDYGFISRSWLELALKASSNRIDFKSPEDDTLIFHPLPVDFHDRIIIRIYRLWKDPSGNSWMEGGLFLRPYDVPTFATTSESPEETRLWHLQEVIYDETSRLVIPLSAWIGRCSVLCPSAYKMGRVADLTSSKEANQFLFGLDTEGAVTQQYMSKLRMYENQHFVCEKLFDRTKNCRIEDISPCYLKVNMRPYCFLRKPDTTSGRTVLSRKYTASQLLEYDRTPLVHSDATASCSVVKPRGEKLARVVDRLERKRQLDSQAADQPVVGSTIVPTCINTLGMSATHRPIASSRGRPRGSRGRARIYKPTSQSPVTQCTEDAQNPSSNTLSETDYPNLSSFRVSSCPVQMNSREPVVELINFTALEEPLMDIENNHPIDLAVVEDRKIAESSLQISTVSINQSQSGLELSNVSYDGQVFCFSTSEQRRSTSDSKCDVHLTKSVDLALKESPESKSLSCNPPLRQLPSDDHRMAHASGSTVNNKFGEDSLPVTEDTQGATNTIESALSNLDFTPSCPLESSKIFHENARTRTRPTTSIHETLSVRSLRKRKQQPRTRNSSTSAAQPTDSEHPCFFSDVEMSDNHRSSTCSAASKTYSTPDLSLDERVSVSSSRPENSVEETNTIPIYSQLLKSYDVHSPLEVHSISLESVEELEYSQDAITLSAVVERMDTADQLTFAKDYNLAGHIPKITLHEESMNLPIIHAAVDYIREQPNSIILCSSSLTEVGDSTAECYLEAEMCQCHPTDKEVDESSTLESSMEQVTEKAEFPQSELTFSDSNTTPVLDELSSPSESILSSSKLTSGSIGCFANDVSLLTYLLPMESEANRSICGANTCAIPTDAYCSHRNRCDLPSPHRSQAQSHRQRSPTTRHRSDSVRLEERRDRHHSRHKHHEHHWPIDQDAASSYRHYFDDHRREDHNRWQRDRWEHSPSPSSLSRRHRRKYRSSSKASSRQVRRSSDRSQSSIPNPNE